jgi:hypothetical protein
VNKKEHYQRMAGECVRLARDCSDPANKTVLLDMAQTWVRLAEQAGQEELGRSPDPKNR